MMRSESPKRAGHSTTACVTGCALVLGWLCSVASAGVTFFVNPDGNLAEADPTRDQAFQAALTRPMTELDFSQFGHEYVMEPSNVFAGVVRVRPLLVDENGDPAADLGVNGNRLIETYPGVPVVEGIIEPSSLLNRVFNGGGDTVGAGIEFTFSEPVEGFGAWIMDDVLESNQYVLIVTEEGGGTFTSAPLESANGTVLAIEGFVGVVSDVGIVKVVIQQQTTSGTPSNADFFYVDHVQVGGRFPPEICNNGIDDNGDGETDCEDSECAADPSCPEVCDDGVDNNGNGLIDCADPECQNNPAHPTCGETFCNDGIDNDGDGYADCLDPDCYGKPGCTTEQSCGDGIDNDADGLTDCADPDCSEDPGCPEVCDDGVDNDADGRTDCNDPECSAAPNCPEICGDGIDNNADGIIDCQDPTCSGLPACDSAPTFFLSPDGNLETADPDGDLAFQAALTAPLTEFTFDEYGHEYIFDPPNLLANGIVVRPNLLNTAGENLVDLALNGNRLIETYIGVPDVPGIIEGGNGIPPDGIGAALLNRTFDGVPDPFDPRAAATEFTFSQPVQGFGLWIVDDALLATKYVLKITDVTGTTHVSPPLDSGNGTTFAVEGFIGAVSSVGITRAVVEQQTLLGDPTDGDFYYIDHVQVAGPACGNPRFDADGDGDVDMDDFGALQRCYRGANVPADGNCFCFAGSDGDVDDQDFDAFLQCATRSGVPADPACDD